MTEIVLFVAGLIWGSFSNAAIYRLPLKISLSDPKRSMCPGCKNEIKAVDNIPVLSWLILKGKCRSCNVRISALYPFIEIVHGVLAVISYRYFGPNITAASVFFLLNILVIITVIDLQYMIIPDKINKPGMLLGLVYGGLNQYFQFASFPFSQSLQESAIGLAFGYGLLFLIAWTYLKISGISGLGGGDIKLMGFMGALLGPNCVLPILISSSFAGAIVGVLIMAVNRSNLRTEIPFGPWLALGIGLYIFGYDPIEMINLLTEKLILPE